MSNHDDATPQDWSTTLLLEKWYQGDGAALDRILSLHLDWIHQHARARLGDRLRAKVESLDIVQEAIMQFCHYGPRVRIDDEDHFRRLMVIVVENTIKDTNKFFSSKRRELNRERELAEPSVLHFDCRRIHPDTPSRHLERAELDATIRLGLECLSPLDREALLTRTRDQLSFPEIGRRMGLTSEAVRKRFGRAAAKLEEAMECITRGDMELLLTTLESSSGE